MPSRLSASPAFDWLIRPVVQARLATASCSCEAVKPAAMAGALRRRCFSCLATVVLMLSCNLCIASAASSSSPYSYAEALHKSLLYYQIQRSGNLPYQRLAWRANSCSHCTGRPAASNIKVMPTAAVFKQILHIKDSAARVAVGSWQQASQLAHTQASR